jgi:FKBP-type peptidyl-prolyl cis-trans isomerase 2
MLPPPTTTQHRGGPRLKRHLLAILLAAVPLIAILVVSAATAESPQKSAARTRAATPAIQKGSTVVLEYTLTDEKGEVLDSSTGKEPLTYIHGEGEIIVGLEKALEGLHQGDRKRVTVPPEEAYGPVKPLIEVPKEKIPERARQVGYSLVVRNRNGAPFPVQVKEVKEKTILLDANHPLAGRSLTFEVKVISVEPARRK